MGIAYGLGCDLGTQLVDPDLYVDGRELVEPLLAQWRILNVAPNDALIVLANVGFQIDGEGVEPDRTPFGNRWLGHRQIDPLKVLILEFPQFGARLAETPGASSNGTSIFEVDLGDPLARPFWVFVG
nr:hypothetical protein [Candidatus Chloroploca mongolica]